MSTVDIFITGHGAFSMKRGYFNVPQDCEVRFYIPDGTRLSEVKLRGMLSKGTVKCHDGDSGTDDAVETFAAGARTPNMLLQPLGGPESATRDRFSYQEGVPNYKARDIAPILVQNVTDKSFLLEGIIKNNQKALANLSFDYCRFHWLACRAIIPPRD